MWLEIAEQTYNFKRTESDINEINGLVIPGQEERKKINEVSICFYTYLELPLNK